MKKNYKLYKIQPFNHDYKIVDISKKNNLDFAVPSPRKAKRRKRGKEREKERRREGERERGRESERVRERETERERQ